MSRSEKVEVVEKEPHEVIRSWLEVASDPSAFFEYQNDSDVAVCQRDSVHNGDNVADVNRTSGDGDAVVTYSNGDYFEGTVSEGVRAGVLTRLSDNGALTYARWEDDCLEGVAEEELVGREGVAKSVYRRGVRHGMSRRFGPAKSRSDNLRQVAFYQSGRPKGVVWKGLIGGAYLVGAAEEEEHGKGECHVGGKRCLYLYPDLKTAVVGEFAGDKLVEGRIGRVVGALFENFVPVPEVEVEEGAAAVRRDVSTNVRMSSLPLVSEEWEAARVVVRQSELSAEAGEGLFALEDMDAGSTVALYNGVRLRWGEAVAEGDFDYRIRLNGGVDLDVPAGMTALDRYRATLGHKANHSFARCNVRWARLEHPRFGLICCLVAARRISAGEEVLVNYGLGMSTAPAWYKALWVRHCREDRGMTDEDIDMWCHRRYCANGRRIELDLN